MKILVDEMPKKAEECQFSFFWQYAFSEKLVCTFRGVDSSHKCFGIENCPYFTAIQMNKENKE